MDEQRRTLVLMRHAKSAYPDGVVDHQRPLASRGIREAKLAGDWLRAHVPPIDTVLCSTAIRTRQTLVGTGIDAPTHYLSQLYESVPGVVIDEINRVSSQVATLLVLGHEPTISAVALGLTRAADANNEAVRRVSAKFPTSALVVLGVPTRWEQLELGGAALIAFQVPR